jgi:hypothetical protein
MLYPQNTIKIEEIRTILAKDDSSIGNKLLDLIQLFKINSLCVKNGLMKHKGYSVSEIVTVLILFPLMPISTIRSFYSSRFNELTAAKKDTFFRLKNNEYFNWRNLLYSVAKKFKTLAKRTTDEAPETPKCLIVDDSVIDKTGKKIEFIGKVFDHVLKRPVLGFKLLLLTFWDGKSLIPLDFSYHNEKGKNKKYPFGLLKRQLKKRFSKQRDKESSGYKRSRELFIDKISNAIALIKRAVKHGFVPDYVLTDSWFSSEKMINTIRKLKEGIIHFLGMVKMDKRLYEYQCQKLNAKELKKRLKSKMKRAKRLNIYYIEIIVNYSDIGAVKLFFTRFSKRSKWRLLMTTNLDLSFKQAIEIYNIRWSIEVLFKECKQLLNLGKSQSNDFDAQIADATISLIVYIMLSFHKRIHCYTSLGALFAQYRDEFIEATVAEKLWQLFLTIQLTIAEIFGIDYTKMMRVVFQIPEARKTLKSLSEIFFEDNFSIETKKAA